MGILLTGTLAAGSVVKGRIVDAATNSPLQYVDVALFKQGSQNLTSGAVTLTSQVNVAPVAPGIFKAKTLREDRALAVSAANGAVEPFTPVNSRSSDHRPRVTIVGTGWRGAQSSVGISNARSRPPAESSHSFAVMSSGSRTVAAS